MRCHVCGSELVAMETNLPFKLNETTIVMDEILARANAQAELEIIRFAA